MFRKQFTDEEKIKWQNTLKKLFVHTGPDKLGTEIYKLVYGVKERTFDANIDRTKTYDDVIVCWPFPPKGPNKPYNECMKAHAQHIQAIIEKYSLTPYLLWSGGLDSTGVFYALLAEGIKFNVIFNQPSYDEYPKLAQQLLNNEIENATPLFADQGEITFPNHVEENKDALYITGFGIDGLPELLNFDYETRQLPIESCIGTLISQELYDATAPSIYKLIETPTVAEYIWSLDIVYRYQSILLDAGKMGLRSYGPKQNTIHFFNTDEFQLYWLNNYKEDSHFVKATDFKMPLKKYILEQNGDAEYFENKAINPSWLFGAYSPG